MRAATEIIRTVLVLHDATEQQTRDLAGGVQVTGLPLLSRGEQIVVRWARVTEELLAGCDAETVDAALEVVERLRAGMAR